jgi:hypothetical protein
VLRDGGQADEDSADDERDDGAGEGFRILNDYRFPQPVGDAEQLYWQTRQWLAQSRATMQQAVWDVYDGLHANAEDVARLLIMSPRQVRRIIERHELELATRQRRRGKS